MTSEDTAALPARFDADLKTVWPELTDRLCTGLDTTFPESVEKTPPHTADRVMNLWG